MKKKNVVIAGGGTGGHIYPGLSLADHLQKNHPDMDIHFVGATGGLEEKIVPRAGYPLHLLKVGRLHHSVGIWRRLKTALGLPLCFLQAMRLYLKLRPQWVLGIGGFASGPFVFVSALFGGKTAILEPNAYPGLTNRWLARLVKTCFIVFDEAGSFFPKHKVVNVGLPVRVDKNRSPQSFPGGRPLKVLVFGGSQGARAINQVVSQWVKHLQEDDQIQLFHQVGYRDFPQWSSDASKDKFVESVEYIHDMPTRLQWADLVICRSGVGSVAEVAMASRPALFIPLPTAADNHQVKNAEVLVNKQAALMIEQKDLSWEVLHQTVLDLKNHPEKLNGMIENLSVIDYSNAPAEIISHLQGDPTLGN